MKKTMLLILMLTVCGSIFASEQAKVKTKKQLDDVTKTNLNEVLEANEKLHAAFYEYNSKLIEENAKILQSKIDQIQNKEIAKLLDFSKKTLDDINSKNDKETNNQKYHLVSMALIHIVKNYSVSSEYDAYSCPMVKKKWVQNSKKLVKVHNPYAPEMPHCGTRDTHNN